MKPTYDTTLARIAGNIAAGLVLAPDVTSLSTREKRHEMVVKHAVALARRIVAEVKRTEPEPGSTEAL